MDAYTGEIRLFPFTFAPRNWALCQGQLMAISQNTALFSLLGTNFGGDGRSTFGLPNLQGQVVVGTGQGAGLSSYAIGQSGGTAGVALALNQMPAHNHNLNVNTTDGAQPTSSGAQLSKAATGGRGNETLANLYNAVSPKTPLSSTILTRTGAGTSHNNLQPYLTMNYCICMNGVYPQRP